MVKVFVKEEGGGPAITFYPGGVAELLEQVTSEWGSGGRLKNTTGDVIGTAYPQHLLQDGITLTWHPPTGAAAAQAGLSAGPSRYWADGGSGHEGKQGCQFHTPRPELCAKIWARLARTGYLLIKAPPQSGKTYMLQELLGRHCAEVHCVYIMLGGQGRVFNIDDLLEEFCGGTLQKLLQGDKPMCIFIDEAQKLYHTRNTNSVDFWEAMKSLEASWRTGSDTGPPVRVVMAAAYGNRTSGAVDVSDTPTATPTGIGQPVVTVTIAPVPVDHYDILEISLLLSTDEYDVLWEGFLAWAELPFGRPVKDFVFHLCGAQVALISTCLKYLASQLHHEQLCKDVLDKNAMLKLLSEDFMTYLKTTVRSLIHYPTIEGKPESMAILRQLLWVDSIPFTPSDASRYLIIAGHVYVNPQDRLCFSSPLHRAWFLYTLFNSPGSSLSINRESTIMDILCCIVERWDPFILRNALTRGKDGRPKEALFHAETYRAGRSFFPHGTVLSPEVGEAVQAHGSVDFIVPSCAMALEFTRDGDRVTQHLDRFLDPLKYRPMLESGLVQQYAVVDVRSPLNGQSPAQPTSVQNENLYTLLLNNNYDLAEVWHKGKQIRVVRLAGTAGAAIRGALTAALQQSQGGAPP